MAAVVVLGNVQLGYWGSSTDGQEHLGDLGSGRVLQVAVLAGVQKSGTGRLDRPTWTTIAALLTVVLLGTGVALLGSVAVLSGISIQMLGCGVALLGCRVALLLVVTVLGTAVAIARVQQNGAQVLATAITGSTGDDLHGGGSSSAGSSSTTSALTLSIAGELAVGLATISTVSTTIAAVAAAESQSGAQEDCESLLEKSIENS